MSHTAHSVRCFCFGIGMAVALGLAGCQRREAWTTLAGPIPSGGKELSFKATLRYTGIEGGFYQLFADDGSHYDPTNLPPQFQHQGLRVEVVAQLRPDAESFHGAGPLVTILRVRPAGR